MKQFKTYFPGIIYMLAVLLLSSCNNRSGTKTEQTGPGQKHDTVVASHEEPLAAPTGVAEIQKAYQAIMSQMEAGVLDSSSFKYSCRGEKNGTVSYFTQQGKLRMIVHRYNEYDHFSATDRYFVLDSMVFFAHLNQSTWSFESGPEGATKDKVTERRIYLVDQKPVKCLEKSYVIRSQSKTNSQPETVPNKEINCASVKSVLQPYKMLVRNRSKAPSGCLEE